MAKGKVQIMTPQAIPPGRKRRELPAANKLPKVRTHHRRV